MANASNNTDRAAPIHWCVFYSHPWALHLLKSPRLGVPERRLVVELASQSFFATALGTAAKPRVGLPTILATPGKLAQLIERVNGVPGDLILAPNPSASPSLQVAAVGVLPYLSLPYDAIVHMIHVAEAADFAHAFGYADRFLFLWDIADPQTHVLPQIAADLARQKLVTRESWAGFFWYTHPHRKTPDTQQHAARFHSSLRPYQSVLAPAK